MRAAVLHGDSSAELIEIERPRAGAGQVVLRVEAASLCGSDLNSFKGINPRARYPKVPGHEVAGVVVEVGPGTDENLIGTLVSVESNLSCGRCPFCLAGLPNICVDYHVLGEGPDIPGGCAEYLAFPANQLYPVPLNATAAEGALVQPFAISYEGVVNRGRIKEGEKLLVIGAGPIGLGAMMIAVLHGAEALVVDLEDDRLEKARSLGARHTAIATDPGLTDLVKDWTSGLGVDLSVEAVGGKQTSSLELAQKLTTRRGRIVVMGSFSEKVVPFPVAGLKYWEQELIGSSGHPRTFGPVIELIASGALQPRKLISHTIGLEGLQDALEMMDKRQDGVMKVVVEPNRIAV